MSEAKRDYQNNPTYHKQLVGMLQAATLESGSPEELTFEYMVSKYDAATIRVLNKTENTMHIIDESRFNMKLRFYNMTFEGFFKEIERVGYTMWFT